MPLRISADAESLARDAADWFAQRADEAIAARGQVHIALSGGNTPRALYRRLAAPECASQVDWQRVHLWWSDERNVPADHADSNYRLADEALIRHILIPPAHVHRAPTELGAIEAAARYESHILESLSHSAIGSTAESPCRFDLILLGLGDDGHTASLFPGALAAIPPGRLVVALQAPKLNAWRVTFTPLLINAARQVAFLVSGQGKAGTLWRVLRGPRQPEALPAQIVAPEDGEVTWWVDRDAAGAL